MIESFALLPTVSPMAFDPDGDDDGDETNIGAVVGGVVGGLALIASVLLLLAFWWHRRRKRAQFLQARLLQSQSLLTM